ncbi:MAG: BatD family protein [Bacteroidales bacterium]|nr:BatD family protein [Bacteroidales bacterium]
MKKLLTILLLSMTALAAFAQSTVKLQAPNVVDINEQFNVTFIIEGEHSPSDFQWNPGENFQLVWGPQKGSSTSVTIVNGKSTRSSQTTYTYVLMPRKAGKFSLQPGVATVKGSELRSESRQIEVVADSSRQQGQGAQQGGGQGTASPAGDVSSEDMFLRLSINKSKVMVGETVTATLKLYQRVNIAGFEDARFPTFNGFWSQEVQAPTNIEFHRETVGDRIYNAAVLREWSLIPQRAGDIRIDPAELVCLINVRAPRASTGSIFDSFFQDEYQTIRKRVSSSAYTVHVNGLPAGAPASFNGAVGTGYKMSVSLTRDSLMTHDAASLKITITGKGNIALLEAPKVNLPPDFELYDVKTDEVSGGKSFEYPFIPRSHGEFDIEPIRYSYYDIAEGRYVSIDSKPLHVSVARNASAGSETVGQIVQGSNRKDVRDLGSDIRFIETRKPSFDKVGAFFVGSPLFWVLTLLILAAGAILFFVLRKLDERRADVAGTKNRAAAKMARKRLSQAGDFLQKNLYTAFYEELHKTLLGFVSDKLTMDAADMSKDNISAKLIDKGVSEGVASDFIGLLDACEYARYSPDSGHDAMNAHYETAVSVISAIDESMRLKKKPSAAGTAAALAAMLMLIPFGGRASDTGYADSLWTAGTGAYTDGDFETAVKSWESVRTVGLESPELYYNIANAYFKSGDISHAILNYERALKLDPSYSDARFNLEFANNQIQDRIEEVPEFFLEVWGRRLCWIMPSDAWAVLSLLALAATVALALLFVRGRTSNMRKVGFFAGIVALLCTLLCLDFAFWQRTDYRTNDKAIITRAVSSVKSSPSGESSTDLFVLHEGTKVSILDEVGDWRNIELADGRQGWIKSSDFEEI